MPSHPVRGRAFTIIESLLMIIALLAFSVVVYSVYKKDFLTPAAQKASAPKPV